MLIIECLNEFGLLIGRWRYFYGYGPNGEIYRWVKKLDHPIDWDDFDIVPTFGY